jgi:gliding motility-associated-like protein
LLAGLVSLRAQHSIPTTTGGTAITGILNLTNVNDTIYFQASTNPPTPPTSGVEPFTVNPINNQRILINIALPDPSGSITTPYFTNFNNIAHFFASNTTVTGGLFRCGITNGSQVLIKDIFPGGAAQPKFLVSTGSLMFFSALNAVNNEELWVSDGTDPGTVMVTPEINPAGSSSPQGLTFFNIAGTPYLFFSAIDSGTDRELWVRNITTGTNTKFAINGAGASNPNQFVGWNNFCYFFANDGTGEVLWRSNGVAAPTKVTLPVGTTVDNTIRPVVANNQLFFVATNATHGKELWKFDGTTASRLTDIAAGSLDSNPIWLTKVGSVLFFTTNTGSGAEALYRTDGTTITTITGVTNPRELADVNGTLYFFVSNPNNAARFYLWKADQTSNSLSGFFSDFTNPLLPLPPLSNRGVTNPSQITEASDDFYLVGNSNVWVCKALVGCPSSVTLSYPSSTVCASGTTSPTVTFSPSGSYTVCASGTCFSSTNPLMNAALNGSTGLINLSALPPGTYPVTYTYNGGSGCTPSNTFNITVNAATATTVTVGTSAGNGTTGNTNAALLTSSFNFGTLTSPAGSIPNDANVSMAFSPDGTKIYVTDEFNHCIRQVDLTANTVTILAGSGDPLQFGFGDGIGTAARFNNPSGVATDAFGIVYVADKGNHVIRKINPSTRQVYLIAGKPGLGLAGGDLDNTDPLAAQFSQPSDIAIAADGSIFITDKNNHKIKKLAVSGGVSTIAGPIGSVVQGFVNGSGTTARFNYPSGIDIDSNGDLYVADRLNHAIRKVTQAGVVTTLTGTGLSGDVLGLASIAQFNFPTDVAISFDGKVYIADRSNHKIKILQGGSVGLYAGSGTQGFLDGAGTTANFNYPSGLATNLNGQIFVVDKNNQRIRNIQEVASTGNVLGGTSVCSGANVTLTLVNFPAPAANIIRWESSTNNGSTWNNLTNAGLATLNVVGITQRTLFRAIVNTGSCGNAPSDTAVVLVNTVTPPTASSSPACSVGGANVPVTLVAAGAFDGDYVWYDNTNAVIPGQNNDTLVVNINSTRNYSVSIRKGSCESTRTAVTATVSSQTAPTASNVSRCGSGTVTFTASGAVAGTVYRWYDNGGILLKTSTNNTDNTFTTGSLTATTTFSVAIFNPSPSPGCESSRVNIQGIVNTPPTAPSVTTPVARCGTGTVVLTANGAVAGQVYRWFDSAGTQVFQSANNTVNTFTSGSLTASTTFSVAIVDGNGCESTRTTINVTVNPIPTAPTTADNGRCNPGTVILTANGATAGLVYRWRNSLGTIVKTSVDNNDNTFTTGSIATTTTFTVSIFNSTTSCESTPVNVQAVISTTPTAPTATDVQRCGNGTVTFTATGAVSDVNLRYRWYDSADNILATSANNTTNTFTTSSLTATTPFKVSIINAVTNCESNKIDIQAIINPIPNAPTTADVNRCGTGTVILTANGAVAGQVYRWRNSLGTQVFQSTDHLSNTFTTGSLASSSTFTVSIVGPGPLNCESNQATINVTVTPIPANPTSANQSRCGDGSVTFSANGATAGLVYRWYDSGNNLVKTSVDNNDNTFTTNSLTTTTNFSVAIFNPSPSPGCESGRVSIQAIINPIPTAPTVTTPVARCGNGTVNLTANGAVSGQVYRWFDSGGNQVFQSTNHTTNTFTTGNLTASTTFSVAIVNSTTGCISSNTAIQVNINAIPTNPTTADNGRCDPGTVTLTANGATTGLQYRWRNSLGTIVKTSVDNNDNTFLTASLTTTTAFTVSILDPISNCESSQINVQAIISPNPTAPTATNVARCEAGTVTFTANGAAADVNLRYRWYDSADNILATSPNNTANTFTTANLTTTTPFKVSIVNIVTNCESNRVDIQAIINPLPTAPTASDEGRCGTGTITLTANGAVAGQIYRWYDSANTLVKTSTSHTDNTFTTGSLTANTTFSVSIVDANTCESSRTTVNVSIVNPPSTVITGNFNICGGSTQTYQAATAPSGQTYVYEWTVSGGNINSGQGTNQLSVTWNDFANGTEYVIIKITVQGTSCVSQINPPGSPTDPGFVTINDLPNPTITGNNNVCANSTVNYSVSAQTNHSYQWTVSGGTITAGAGTNQITVQWGAAGTGTIRVKQTSPANCEKTTADFNVTIQDIPGLPTAEDKFRCGNGPITVSASEANANSFNWYDAPSAGNLQGTGSSFTIPNVTSSFSLWVAAVNTANCEGPRKEVKVTLNPGGNTFQVTPTVVDADSCVASGNSPSGKISLAITGSNSPYQFVWTKDGDAAFTANTQNISGLTLGTYRVTITDAGGCSANFSYVVNEVLKTVTDIVVTNDTTIALGASITLKASAKDDDKFIWVDNSTGQEIGTGSEVTVTPTTNTSYTVTIINDRNCSVTRTIQVSVQALQVFIPNLFTPNGDTKNDLFQIYGLGIKSVELRIFNRIGQLVYQSNQWVDGNIDDPERLIGWDGTYQGKPLDNGIYTWYIQGKFINDSEITYNGKKSGTVSLQR